MRVFFAILTAAALAIAVGCTGTSADIEVTGPAPQIVNAAGPTAGALGCDPDDPDAGGGHPEAGIGGGNCPLAVKITFTLPAGQFVDKALVRFQGDGSDVGIDREFPLVPVYGKDAAPVTLTIEAAVPTDILRRGALYRYEIRLVTGAGGESLPAALTVSVT